MDKMCISTLCFCSKKHFLGGVCNYTRKHEASCNCFAISLPLCSNNKPLLQTSPGILFGSEQRLTSATLQPPTPTHPLCCSPSAIPPTPSPPTLAADALSLLLPSRPLPITCCAHAFCICSITSAQYFSFLPTALIYIPPPCAPPRLLFLSPVFSAVWVTLDT